MRWGCPALCLALAAGAAAAAELSVSPSRVVLGRTAQVELRFQLPPLEDEEAHPLNLAVNVGTVGEVERTGPGLFRAVYRPPPSRFPQVALVVAWRDGIDAEIAPFRIPLIGVTKLPVSTLPGAKVRVRVGDRKLGPVRADDDGAATFTLEIPPGTPTVRVLATLERTTESDVPIEVPPYNRIVMVAVPRDLPASAGSARVEVFYAEAGERAPRPEEVAVESDSGTAALVSGGGGRYVFRFTPAKRARGDVRLAASVRGDPGSRGEAAIRVEPRPLPPPRAEPISARPAPSDPGASIEAGVRLGFAHTFAGISGPRFGADAWMRGGLWGGFWGAGLAGTYGWSEQRLSSATGPGVGRAHWFSLAARVGPDVELHPRLRAQMGASVALGYASVASTLAATRSDGWGLGAGAFATVCWGLGPGELAGELSYTFGPISGPDFRGDFGGLAAMVGYRLILSPPPPATAGRPDRGGVASRPR